MMRIRKKEKSFKPNIIPVLDSIFIFIFFLLMSAQFLQIYELDSQAPAIKLLDTQKTKKNKEPLNLILHITKDKILVKTGLDEKIYKKIGLVGKSDFDLKLLNKTLIEVKKKNLKEGSVILRPNQSIKYKNLVHIIDAAKTIHKDHAKIILNKEGKRIESKKLFDQIIFDTII